MIYPVKQEEESPYAGREVVRVRLRKLEELPDAAVPNNKPVGFLREGYYMKALPPTKGQPFYLFSNTGHIRDRGLQTSTVQEVIDARTFRTHNSIYQLEVLGEPGSHAWDVEEAVQDKMPTADKGVHMRLVRAFFEQTMTNRFRVGLKLGLLTQEQIAASNNNDQLSANILLDAKAQGRLGEVWPLLFNESVDPNPYT
jgi:hypothetical protein